MSDRGRLARSAVRSRWAAVGAAVAVSIGGGGFFAASAAPGPAESTIVSVTPTRVLDTRDPANLGLAGPFVSPMPQKLQITGSVSTSGGSVVVVPAGATGVLLNVTAVNPTANGFISIRPGDATGAPATSSLNVESGSNLPNAVQVALPTAGANAGKIDITYDAYGRSGLTTELLIDVVGYMTNAGLQQLVADVATKANAADVYNKAQIDKKLPPSGVITIAGPAFQPTDGRATGFTDGTGCSTFNLGVAGATAPTLDASVPLPVGVRITSVTVLIGNVFLFGNLYGGNATFNRRTLTGLTTLASLDSYGLPAGLNSRTAPLAVPDLVASGSYYFIRFLPNANGLGTGTSVCGAEVAYTTPS